LGGGPWPRRRPSRRHHYRQRDTGADCCTSTFTYRNVFGQSTWRACHTREKGAQQERSALAPAAPEPIPFQCRDKGTDCAGWQM